MQPDDGNERRQQRYRPVDTEQIQISAVEVSLISHRDRDVYVRYLGKKEQVAQAERKREPPFANTVTLAELQYRLLLAYAQQSMDHWSDGEGGRVITERAAVSTSNVVEFAHWGDAHVFSLSASLMRCIISCTRSF